MNDTATIIFILGFILLSMVLVYFYLEIKHLERKIEMINHRLRRQTLE